MTTDEDIYAQYLEYQTLPKSPRPERAQKIALNPKFPFEYDWQAAHPWRKAAIRYNEQRHKAAIWWADERQRDPALARRAWRFIKAHRLSMVDVLLEGHVVGWNYFVRDANKIGPRTRRTFERHRIPHPGPHPAPTLRTV